MNSASAAARMSRTTVSLTSIVVVSVSNQRFEENPFKFSKFRISGRARGWPVPKDQLGLIGEDRATHRAEHRGQSSGVFAALRVHRRGALDQALVPGVQFIIETASVAFQQGVPVLQGAPIFAQRAQETGIDPDQSTIQESASVFGFPA